MPYVKSLQQEYMQRHGINLTTALTKLGLREGKGEGECVGPWILHWTHLMASCVQLLSVLKEPKIAACVPCWICKSVKTIMDKYSPFEDALDLGVFERTCVQQRWMVDQIMLCKASEAGVAAAVASGVSTGGDLVQLCVVECINKVWNLHGCCICMVADFAWLFLFA